MTRHQLINRFPFWALAITLGVLLANQNLLAQAQTTSPERGFHPGNSYATSNIETISQQSGNLMLNIPLGSLPAGRGGMSAGINLNYNSKIWDLQRPDPVAPNYSTFDNLVPSVDGGGWNYQYQYNLKSDYNQISPGVCETRLYIVSPDGSQHLLWLKDFTDSLGRISMYPDGTFDCSTNPPGFRAQSSNLTFFTLDGTFMRVVVEGDNDASSINNRWTIYMPDGSEIIHNPNHSSSPQTSDVLQRIVDRNGNSIDFTENSGDSSYSNHRTTTITDQLSRKVVIEYNAATDQDWIHSTGYNAADLITKVQWKTITVNKTYLWCTSNCLGGTIYKTLATNFRMVDKVYLPAPSGNLLQFGGLDYEFNYNADATSNPSTGWGEVSHVKLPSGAYSDYTYQQSSSAMNVGAQLIIENRPAQKTLTSLKEYDGSSSSSEIDTWAYSSAISTYYTSYTTTAPDGSTSTEYDGGWNGAANPTNSMYNEGFTKPYKSVGPDGTTTESVYANNIPGDASIIASANQFVKYELTSITDNSGALSKTAIKEYSRDKNGNVTQVKEYDFVPYSSIPRDSNGRATGLPSNASSYLKRITNTDYYNDVPDSASTTYTDADSYHLSSSPRLLNLVKSNEVQNASGTPQARSEMSYDYTAYSTNTKAGNLTESKAWDSNKGGSTQVYSNPLTTGNSISTTVQYNAYGMPTLSTDARGYQTQITYGSVNGYPDLYPTQTVAAYGTTIQRTSTAQYDFSTGLVTTAKDVDNNVSATTTYDALGRATKVAAAVNTAQEVWTQTDYDDAGRRVTVKSDLATKGDAKRVGTQFYDQLGRVRLSKTLEDAQAQSGTNETDGIKVQTRYLTTTGYTYQLTSNPYRANYSSGAGSEPSMGWTQSKSTGTGRHSEMETFSGAGLPSAFGGSNTSSTGKVQTDSDADRTLVTDQAGKQRISKSNALGQLTDVWEVTASDSSTAAVTFPNQALSAGYQTSYVYNTLNNLTTVNQGSQTRTFTYSSLSRLTSAQNPESGTIGYTYDNNGNLSQKTDARSIQTNYAYDALNRVTQRSYSDGVTPTVTYTYDNITNAKGRLTKVSSTVSTTEYTSFDILGRVLSQTQTTDGTAYATSYSYNLSGALISETYPSGRVVQNVIDNKGDLELVQSKKNGNAGFWNYAKSFTYTAAGAVSSMQLGNGKWESTLFNSRLQPTQIAVGTVQGGTDNLLLNYTYSTTPTSTDNNGNVLAQTITVPTVGTVSGFVATQAYTYDSLNRLKSATENIGGTQSWKQTFLYDRYGNRNFDTNGTNTTTLGSCSQAKCNPTVDTTNNNNRFTTAQGYTYDLSGNLVGDTNSSNRTFVYDADNKQTSVSDSSGSLGTYYYDGDGKRVKKVVGTETTIFVYDASGKMVAEYATTLSTTPQVSYLTSDHLGSPRINTNANGAVIARHDYMPFGEEIDSTITSVRDVNHNYGDEGIRQKFTAYERDNESGLDYAKARMFGSSVGRFTSPDNFLNATRPENPATWNLYAYVLNNPLRYVDPSGEIERDADGNVIFHKTGEKNIEFKKKEALKDSNGKEIKINGKTAYVTISWKADVGYVKANDGTKIDASKATTGLKIEITDKKGNVFQEETNATQKAYDGAGYNDTTDCHGNTFASGQVWINNDQVENLMKGDGYRQVGKKETVQAGDVGIYSTDGTLSPTSVQHSVTVNDAGATSVTSKGGITPLQSSIAPGPGPGTAWGSESVKLNYWTQRSKPKN